MSITLIRPAQIQRGRIIYHRMRTHWDHLGILPTTQLEGSYLVSLCSSTGTSKKPRSLPQGICSGSFRHQSYWAEKKIMASWVLRADSSIPLRPRTGMQPCPRWAGPPKELPYPENPVELCPDYWCKEPEKIGMCYFNLLSV